MATSAKPKNLDALEAATPTLIKKLAEMSKTLTPEEKQVLSEIVESAAIHTKLVQAHEEGDGDLVFMKPKSVHSTIKMKKAYADLPKKLGLGKK
ncbi:hypothetical protein [Roseateles depolymerans]|uniref:Uncharacterized protein n=1 Tax=Roseateles depolymerans TaxID=76731 RepID=A0A0U3MZS3_9BURK|nr:hypothetical protein [Roseateles depolymerans]ALV07412.1 hypothetical protein RD2015_2950 [Roseateles depolymerans]REG22374.1 hypothetical protein DES44_1522 [Roseateles depolymerans]